VNRVFEAALEIDRFCRERLWPFCIIGGVAVQRWGEPRGTQDVDLTILTGFGVLKAFAGRVLDWHDVDGVAVRQAGRLDQKLIFRELAPLLELKGTSEAADRLRKILRKAR